MSASCGDSWSNINFSLTDSFHIGWENLKFCLFGDIYKFSNSYEVSRAAVGWECLASCFHVFSCILRKRLWPFHYSFSQLQFGELTKGSWLFNLGFGRLKASKKLNKSGASKANRLRSWYFLFAKFYAPSFLFFAWSNVILGWEINLYYHSDGKAMRRYKKTFFSSEIWRIKSNKAFDS